MVRADSLVPGTMYVATVGKVEGIVLYISSEGDTLRFEVIKMLAWKGRNPPESGSILTSSFKHLLGEHGPVWRELTKAEHVLYGTK